MARKPKVEADEAAPMLSLIDQDAPEGSALVVQPDANPAEQAKAAAALVYVDPVRFDQFYERMREETAKHVPDVSTAAGRDAIRSLAFRVTKTKTALDKAGLDLTADWRAKVNAVNKARGPIVDRLAALADEVRKPLTEWEAAEAARVAANDAVLADLRAAAVIADDDTSETVAERGRRAYFATFPDGQWLDDERAVAEEVKAATVASLLAACKRLKVEEAERAELEALRAEKAEREAREAAEQAERDRIAAEEEAERQRVAAAEQAERDRLAAIKAEEDRVERVRQEAAEQARREAEAEREREREAERAEHERQLAAEREAREKLEREAREREEAAQREREAEAARQREAEAAKEREAAAERERVADREHRAKVQGEVRDALLKCGLDHDTAWRVVTAIVAGNIVHCEVKF